MENLITVFMIIFHSCTIDGINASELSYLIFSLITMLNVKCYLELNIRMVTKVKIFFF